MRYVVTLLTGLALVVAGACSSASDYTSPSSVGGAGAMGARGGGGGSSVTGAASATGAIDGSFSGTFDSGGNFSGSGTAAFDLTNRLDLVTGGTFGDLAACGDGSVHSTASGFTTLSGSGGSLLAMTAGQQIIKSVRFAGWATNVPKGQGPTGCGLHFRGDAILDGVTEMSRMLTTCTAHDGATCSEWTMEPCTSALTPCGADDTPVEGLPVGQLYGDFPKGVGNRPMARYVTAWAMTIAKN